MIKKLQFQEVVKELCGLCHPHKVVGDARNNGKVAVDKQADSWRAADAKDILSLSS